MSGGILYFISINPSDLTELANSMITPGEPGGVGVERLQAVVGNWISLCVKCCRMVDSILYMYTISIL